MSYKTRSNDNQWVTNVWTACCLARMSMQLIGRNSIFTVHKNGINRLFFPIFTGLTIDRFHEFFFGFDSLHHFHSKNGLKRHRLEKPPSWKIFYQRLPLHKVGHFEEQKCWLTKFWHYRNEFGHVQPTNWRR